MMRTDFLSIPLLALISMSPAVGEQDYGLTAEKTYQMKTAAPEQILFIDVRDPVEIQFVGFTDSVDLNIPFLLVDRFQWSEQHNRFEMTRNPDFIKFIDQALKNKGLTREARIITMCRSGSARGEPSATFLRENGFPNAFFVIHGFQGNAVSEGKHTGRRLLNGWQNSDLPWSNRVPAEKIFRPKPPESSD